MIELDKLQQKALDEVTVDADEFRTQVEAACRVYTKQERRVVKVLTEEYYYGLDFIEEWLRTGFATRADIEKAPDSNGLLKTLAKHFHMSEVDASAALEPVKDKRVSAFEQEFVDEFYEGVSKRARKRLLKVAKKHLFSRSHSEVVALHDHAAAYEAYTGVAHSALVSYVDPYDGWRKRRRYAKIVRKEEATYGRTLKKRRQYAAYRLAQLSGVYDGLIEEIIGYDWNVALIISLRNKYEKSAQATSTRQSVARQLRASETFDEITREFLTVQAKKYTGAGSNLVDITEIKCGMAIVLARVFELSTVQKNQLVLVVKEYKDLARESDQIQKRR